MTDSHPCPNHLRRIRDSAGWIDIQRTAFVFVFRLRAALHVEARHDNAPEREHVEVQHPPAQAAHLAESEPREPKLVVGSELVRRTEGVRSAALVCLRDAGRGEADLERGRAP